MEETLAGKRVLSLLQMRTETNGISKGLLKDNLRKELSDHVDTTNRFPNIFYLKQK